MLKKIKEYFAQKREIRMLTLDTLYKINSVFTTISDLAGTASDLAGTFHADELKQMMNDLNKIAQNPELTTTYYEQISRQAHEQKMAETNTDN